MKVAILAGGLGSRISEETEIKPKPMVEIGGRPILWHIMKHYSHHGFNDFVIGLGYKGEVIKRYMVEYASLHSDLSVSLRDGRVARNGNGNGSEPEDWNIDLIETGQETATGGRIKRLAPHMGDGTFMLTWGDGVSNVDLDALLAFHRGHGKLATLTAVRPPARFGHLELDGDRIGEFSEKPQIGEGWINGGFFVLSPAVLDLIPDDATLWEHRPLEHLASAGELMAYRHTGFWHPMDTLRDVNYLERLWGSGEAPWKVWT
jgi:glucose-1-phosphate cytidylyltransferase